MVVTEVPGLAPDVLRRGPEHRALDGHSPMRVIVVPRREQALDRQSEQHDALTFAIEEPARHLVASVETGHRADLEAHALQFGPGAAQELHGGADRQVEPVETSVQRRERGAHDLAAAEATVTPVTSSAAGGGGGGGSATGHEESLGGVPAVLGVPSERGWWSGHSLTEMDGRLCSKVACAREAVATLTYDYGDKMAALGPLAPASQPHAHDLCAPHADRLSLPAGWLVVRHEALRA